MSPLVSQLIRLAAAFGLLLTAVAMGPCAKRNAVESIAPMARGNNTAWSAHLAQRHWDLGWTKQAWKDYVEGSTPAALARLLPQMQDDFILWAAGRHLLRDEMRSAAELIDAGLRHHRRAGSDTLINRYLLVHGDHALACKDYTKAETIFSNLCSADQPWQAADHPRFRLAELAMLMQDHQRCESIATSFFDDPNVAFQARARYQLAHLRHHQEHYHAALFLIKQAIALDDAQVDFKLLKNDILRHYDERLWGWHMDEQPRPIAFQARIRLQYDIWNRSHKQRVTTLRFSAGSDREEFSVSQNDEIGSRDLLVAAGPPTPGDGTLQVFGGALIRVDLLTDQAPAQRVIRQIWLNPISQAQVAMGHGTLQQRQAARLRALIEQPHAETAGDLGVDTDLRPGQDLHIEVFDADRNISSEQDLVMVTLTDPDQQFVKRLTLLETSAYSGVFHQILPTHDARMVSEDPDSIPLYPGSVLVLGYSDSKRPVDTPEQLELTVAIVSDDSG